jgi:hypothetical protein
MVSHDSVRAASEIAGAEVPMAPPVFMTVLYMCCSIALLGAYAYTLWSNQNDPGRVLVWVTRFREYLHGAF